MKKPKLDEVLAKCDSEDTSTAVVPASVTQPLYIDEGEETIKCKWCCNWNGSQEVKVINQHVRKSKSHCSARVLELNLPQPKTTGAQMNITDFFHRS